MDDGDEPDIDQRKRKLRSELKAMLKAIDPAARFRMSQSASTILIHSNLWTAAKTVFAYASLPSELETSTVLRSAIEEGKVLGLPKVSGMRLHFHRIERLDDLREKNQFGILEPSSGLPIIEAAESPGLLVIVPGLAFTSSGKRLGRGGGFYDRFLPTAPSAVTVGFCFESQLADDLPLGPKDQTVGYVATERRIIVAAL